MPTRDPRAAMCHIPLPTRVPLPTILEWSVPRHPTSNFHSEALAKGKPSASLLFETSRGLWS